MLLGLPGPLKEAFNVPILCTLQGEDLFLDGLQEPYRTEALNLIREQIEYVDLFLPVSEYYADFMPGYLGIPREKIRVVPLGINPQGFELREQNRSGPFTIGFLGASRLRKDCTCWRRRIGCCVSRVSCRKRDSKSPATWRRLQTISR